MRVVECATSESDLHSRFLLDRDYRRMEGHKLCHLLQHSAPVTPKHHEPEATEKRQHSANYSLFGSDDVTWAYL